MMNTYEELILQIIIECLSGDDFMTREAIEERIKEEIGNEDVYNELSSYVKELLDVTYKIF